MITRLLITLHCTIIAIAWPMAFHSPHQTAQSNSAVLMRPYWHTDFDLFLPRGGDYARPTYDATRDWYYIAQSTNAHSLHTDAYIVQHNTTHFFEQSLPAEVINGTEYRVTGVGSPAVCGPLVVVAAQHSVVAFTADAFQQSDAVAWTATLPDNDPATAMGAEDEDIAQWPTSVICSVSANLVLVPTRQSIHAFRLNDGSKLWNRTLAPNAPPVYSASGNPPSFCESKNIVLGTVVTLPGYAWVIAVNATTGSLLWQQMLPGHTQSTTNIVLNQDCSLAFVGANAGVFVLTDLSNTSTSSHIQPVSFPLGMCATNSLSLAVVKNATTNVSRTILVSSGHHNQGVHSEFENIPVSKYANSSCASFVGSIAVELNLIDLNNSTLLWKNLADSHNNLPIFFSAHPAISSDGTMIWCQIDTLYAADVTQTGNLTASSRLWNGCQDVIISRNNTIASKNTHDLLIYHLSDTKPSTQYSTTTTTVAGVTTTPGKTSHSTETLDTTTPKEEKETCEEYIAACTSSICAPAIAKNTCRAIKCKLFCNHINNIVDCKKWLPDLCEPSKAVDQPCDVDCNKNYSHVFAPLTQTTVVTATTTGTTRAPDQSTPDHSRPIVQPSNEGPAHDTSIWIYIGISAAAFWCVAIVLIVCCILQHRKDKHKYVLLQLEDDVDEPF